ncbi:PhzF family phenazine biosynthesis protein [uncultured Kiloniella sp.]|uniref:PhzF family phenazine biosynthesis protein n=1 Tax=uncultured Kiloniella sp. TaxID=1133091 RepID=UPI002626C141|nr:PhzF family phenazine biosynthesis protein [uncultured Kiloniella sp.]
MMEIPLYQVDAFTGQLFSGNPAAVCPLTEWLPDDLLSKIAAENNLSETAFFVATPQGYHLRWFTPTTEVDLCGHATLATAHVIATELDQATKEVLFETKSGVLKVTCCDGQYTLDFPSRRPSPLDGILMVEEAIGVRPQATYISSKLMAVLDDEESVLAVEPNFDKVAELPGDGLIITSTSRDYDYVARYFGPHCGIPEDPVTGSAHVVCAPYWKDVLGKSTMIARQLSKRGGVLEIKDCGDRILLTGTAILYLKGVIYL